MATELFVVRTPPETPMASEPLRILSLGAGVQSTTMALMAAHGLITPMPDAAIFADTQEEPKATYDHLKWLMSPGILPFPVHVTTRGNLFERMLAGDDEGYIPFFVKAGGMSYRHCTRNYKVRPVRRKAREIMEAAGKRTFEQWIGISTDEASRMKPSGVGYVTNRWPLIELRMSRRDCIRWLEKHNYQTPPKSSCVFCPYKNDGQWRELRDSDADGWARAVAVDAAMRSPDQIDRFHGELYAHRSCVPLDHADLSTAEDRGQINMFNDECEGMCGV